ISRVSVEHEDHPVEHVVIDRPQTLEWLANQSALTLHMTASRLDALDSPDWVAFDFDPAGEEFGKVVPLARALHGLLEELKLSSVPKTSGKRGLNVFVPIARGHRFVQVYGFAQTVAKFLTSGFARPLTT